MKQKLQRGIGMVMAGLVTLASAAVSVAGTPLGAWVPANHPAIIYEGRYDADPSGAIQLGFPGVTVHLRFRGPELILRADASADDLYFDVSIDGAVPALLRLGKGEGDYRVVPRGGDAEHAVSLTRRNESWQGTCSILGFDLGVGGELFSPAALPKRKLMFIGDSVTSGEMTTYETGREMKARLNSSAAASYGMILARRLGAQCHLVSYGGRGIIRDWQGNRGTRNAPQFYQLALPDDPTVPWKHSRYVPDAIGIQLGTNDFSSGIPDQEEFVTAYVQLIVAIRRDAPDAVIFLMDSPILKDDADKGPRRTILHLYLDQIVARVGSSKVMLAPLAHYPGVPGNGHPTGAEHVAMATELEPVLRRALGW